MAEPVPQDPASRSTLRGANQTRMRAHNERLVLSMLRRHGALAKSDIARATGLSAQTVSVIMRALEEDRLIVRDAPKRGKVGQPLVPMRLAPEGAYFFGLKVGRRSVELVLVDFLGRVRGRVSQAHRFPTPDATLRFATGAIGRLTDLLDDDARARISGIGIAIPFQLWEWGREIGVAEETAAAWRDRNIAGELAEAVGLPVYTRNDASAACAAELVFGRRPAPRNFLYFFVGYFVGGGLVLNGSLFTGLTGNAAALGSMPVPDPGGGTHQLIEVASLSVLERMLQESGSATDGFWQSPTAWRVDADILERWTGEAARALAFAITGAVAVLDVQRVLIDGSIPEALRAELVAATGAAMDGMDLAGLVRPRIEEGTIGPDARSLGAASVPLSERFLVDQTALLIAG